MQAIADRTLIRELMDRYGIVHDSGTPEEYAALFTADGEIAVAAGGPAIVKGREALMAQARRDHERFGNEPAANGKTTSIMRHLISNAQITITGAGTATGTCYVTTVVKKGDVGPSILSISRYTDRYVNSVESGASSGERSRLNSAMARSASSSVSVAAEFERTVHHLQR
jgi:hypothetical protein